MERKQTLKSIEDLTKSLDKNFLVFGISYFNYRNIVPGNISPNKKNEFELCIHLRDSIGYRIGCINFHLNALLKFELQILNKIQSNPFDIKMQNNLLMYSAEQHLFLLDDIVFHIISLFDYLGNLIGFRFYGRQRAKLKWKGIVGWCKNVTLEKRKTGKVNVNNSIISPAILKYQQSLVFRLEEYRASLFHYGKDSAKSQVTMNLMIPQRSKFTVGVPEDLQKWIKGLAVRSEEELTLIDAAAWLVKQSFTAANEILILLIQDLKKASQ